MNHTLIRLTTLPARLPRTLSKALAFAAPAVVLLAGHANAAAGAAASTLGGRFQAAATDLTLGGGYILQILGYLMGGAAMLAGIYTIWQHSKNPNGQAKFGYGLVSVLAGGAFLTASLFGTFSSQTLSGAGPTNTGTAAQMTFQ